MRPIFLGIRWPNVHSSYEFLSVRMQLERNSNSLMRAQITPRFVGQAVLSVEKSRTTSRVGYSAVPRSTTNYRYIPWTGPLPSFKITSTNSKHQLSLEITKSWKFVIQGIIYIWNLISKSYFFTSWDCTTRRTGESWLFAMVDHTM